MARKKKTSKKKTSRSKAVGKVKSALPANWKDQLREDAAEEAERTPTGTGNRITLKRNGQFNYQGADLGDSIDLVIVDHIIVKQYFAGDYDEDNPGPPNCFALKPDAKNIAPHPDAPDIQSEICSDCWANEWSSGRGRGKACKDKNRLACLHVEDLEGDLVLLEVPVTSGAAFNKYVKGLTKAGNLPSYAVITRMDMDEHADYQKLIFSLIDELPDKQLAGPFSKRAEAREMLMEPYDSTGFEVDSGKKSSRKKKAKKKASRPRTRKKTAKKKRRRSRVS